MDHFNNDGHCRRCELMSQYGYGASEPTTPVEIIEWSTKDGPPWYYRLDAETVSAAKVESLS